MSLPISRPFTESEIFLKNCKELFGTHKHADSALEGAKVALGREEDLSKHELIDVVTGLRAYKSVDLPTIPQVVIYFTVSDDRVHLHDILRSDET